MEHLKNKQGYQYQRLYGSQEMPDLVDICNKISDIVDSINLINQTLQEFNEERQALRSLKK